MEEDKKRIFKKGRLVAPKRQHDFLKANEKFGMLCFLIEEPKLRTISIRG